MITATKLRTGSRVPYRSLKHMKTYDKGRVCLAKTRDGSPCTTILSITNGKDYCYTHQPKKIPRNRGLKQNGPMHIPISEGAE